LNKTEAKEVVEPQRASIAQIRRRALAGVALVAGRGVAIRLVGFGGNIVLARLLLPRDFGLVAFGMTLIVFAGFMADAGLGAGLIGRRDAPRRADLEGLLGLQLLITFSLGGVAAAAAWPFGTGGKVLALMVVALPFTVMKTPGTILLERGLSYRTLTSVEVAETVAYFSWSIAAVAAGAGVWGLATGFVVRSVVGAALMFALAPVRIVRPRLSWNTTRTLLGFGVRFQAIGIASLLRDQGLNLGTAAIAGVSTLGIWGLASRLLSIPFLLFESAWRVSYPALSQLRAAGDDVRGTIERGISVMAVATGVLLVPLVGGGTPLVTAVFGNRWHEAAGVLPPAALGLMVSGPISAATAGYLYALGDAATPLRGTVLHTLAWTAVGLPLLPFLGPAALGLGWLAAGVVEATVLGRATAAHSHARIISPLAIPTAAAVVAAAAGWVLASSLPASLVAAIAGVATAECLYLAGLFLLSRRQLSETAGVATRAMRAAVART
jgi:polysaccharide transporter, PST family